MLDDNSMAKRGKALEDEYFHRKEKELIEKLRQRRAAEAQLKELAAATGIPNEEILQTLQELGYTRDTVALLHLVPLIHIAWVDGSVTSREREMILEAAGLRGVEQSSPAYQQLTEWLDHRPSEEFFDKTLRIISGLLETTPERDQAGASSVLSESIRIAGASGGILGFGNKISDEEQALLQRIAAAVGADDSSLSK